MLNLKTALFVPAPVKSVRRSGFTLLQVLVVIGVLGILAAVLIGSFRRVRIPAERAKCDLQLKQVVLALDNFRQEKGHLPTNLNELVTGDYIRADALHCPADRSYDESLKADASYSSYRDDYVIREPRDSGELPVIVCPFHEADGSFGAQGFKGGYTKQFAAHPAILPLSGMSGAVTVTRPGVGVLPAPTASKPVSLRGGDRVRVGAGAATITFEDGSTANITANSDMSVLQSFTEGQRSGGLYTLVRQFSGKVNYFVNPDAHSHFDVATPTATAGALGTKFTITIVPASSLASDTTTLTANQLETVLQVTEHTVALTTTDRTINVSDTEPAVNAHDPKNLLKVRVPRLLSTIISNLLGGKTTSGTTGTGSTGGSSGNNGDDDHGGNGNNGNGNGNNGNGNGSNGGGNGSGGNNSGHG